MSELHPNAGIHILPVESAPRPHHQPTTVSDHPNAEESRKLQLFRRKLRGHQLPARDITHVDPPEPEIWIKDSLLLRLMVLTGRSHRIARDPRLVSDVSDA